MFARKREIFSNDSVMILNRRAGLAVLRGLFILSISIIHNPGCIEGSRGKTIVKSLKANQRVKKSWLERGEINPKAAYGFLTLNSSYNKYESPDKDETRVGVLMEPTFVIEIDSLAWRMGLEIRLEVAWQDRRVWWRKDNVTNPGDNFTFEPSILQ